MSGKLSKSGKCMSKLKMQSNVGGAIECRGSYQSRGNAYQSRGSYRISCDIASVGVNIEFRGSNRMNVGGTIECRGSYRSRGNACQSRGSYQSRGNRMSGEQSNVGEAIKVGEAIECRGSYQISNVGGAIECQGSNRSQGKLLKSGEAGIFQHWYSYSVFIITSYSNFISFC